MTTRRPLVAALVTLSGVAITAGSLLPWVGARDDRPASGITQTSLLGLRHFAYEHSATPTSFAVLVAAAGILVVIAGLAAWRPLAVVFSVVALGAAALWVTLNAHHYSPTDLRYNDLRIGAWLTAAGGFIALLAAVPMRRRDASADTSPWDSAPGLAGDRPDGAPHEPDTARERDPVAYEPDMGRRERGYVPPQRRNTAWQPGLRYPPRQRPRPQWVQDRDGFRVPNP